MTTTIKNVLFDPGFAQHTTILSINLEYIYSGINAFKNFGQKKMKFKMAYPKILKMIDNNAGFCLGCILWAVYIKSLGDLKIDGNPCLGDTYNEAESVEEIDYSINYYEQLKKDAKYYLGVNYEVNPQCLEILNLYREFLTLNENFVNTKTTDDVKLPESVKIPEQKYLDQIHSKIQEVIKSGELLDLTEVLPLITR